MGLRKTYTEEELVFLLKKQDNDAFSYLYDNYSGALYGIINNIVPDKETANDVLQEVFINIWRKANLYDAKKGRLFTWMLNIARNASIDRVRSRTFQESRRTETLAEDFEVNAPAIEPAVSDSGLKKVLAKLKEEHRQLLDLSYMQGFTHEEIAKMLSIPLGTVKTRIRTALTQLRTMLQV